MRRILDAIVDHPVAVLIFTLLLSALAATRVVDPFTGEVQVRINPSPEVLLPPSGDARKLYDRARRMVGGEDPIVVALGFPDVFDRGSLERVVALTHALEDVDGVARVLSLATAVGVRGSSGDVEVARFLEGEVPEDPEARAEIARHVLENPLYSGILASVDRSTTAIFLYLEPMSDVEFLESGIDDEIAAIASREAGEAEVWISGFPHFKAKMSTALQRDLFRIVPMFVVVLALMLSIVYRSVRGALVPLATIGLSLVLTMAGFVLMGAQLNVVTVIVPPLVLILGYAYTMHILCDYYRILRRQEPGAELTSRELVREVMHEVGTPVLVTGVTTAAGFLALAISPIPGVQQFGLGSLMGVAMTVFMSLTFAPAVLCLLPMPRRIRAETGAAVLGRLADVMADFAVKRRNLVITLGFVLLIVSMIGASRIVVGSGFVSAFQADNPVRVQFEAINSRLGGANAIQILVEGRERRALLEPANLKALHELQEWLEAQDGIGRVISIVDYLMVLNRAFHDGDEAYFAVPERNRMAIQLLFMGASEESSRMLDAAGRVANITAFSAAEDSTVVGDLVARIDARLAELPEGLESYVTGQMVLVSHSVNEVARGQWISLLIAFGIIYIVLAALFTSWRVGLVALLPNFLPIAAYFGALGFTGITLNTSTGLVGCLALGIAVDDTIHYFARFNSEARKKGNELEATRSALGGLINPVTFTSLGLVLGFLLLTTASLRPQIEFGALAAFTLAVAWVLDVTLSPALCSRLRVVTLWDLITLDLGHEPQHSIPLFQDLSARQARMFALLSDVRDVKAGELLMKLGEKGQDVFVVVDGSLSAWVERDGHRVELARMTRGDPIGEIGHFAGGRTANVEAVTDARLIRFEPEDLDRISRRRPRIAAVVYRNLARIQAARLARTTERLR